MSHQYPGVQSEQEIEFPELYFPTGHMAGSVDGSKQKKPSGQTVQLVIPEREKVPAGQPTGERAGSRHLIPLSQMLQTADPDGE